MMIQCPGCGRAGNLPGLTGLVAHTVRCRRCSARFVTIPLQVDSNAERDWPAREPAEISASTAGVSTPTGFEGLVAAGKRHFDAPPNRPGDSHYESTATFDDEFSDSSDSSDRSDSQVELPAFSADDLESDESMSAWTTRQFAGALDVDGAGASYLDLVEAWGRCYHLYIALAFGAASLAVMGYFLVRPLLGGHSLSSSATALVVGCVGTVAFLLLTFTATTLNILLLDLGKNVRQLMVQSKLGAGTGADRSRQNRTGLSQTPI